MPKLFRIAVLLLSGCSLYAQISEKSFIVKYTNEKIQLDGILNDSAWTFAESAGDFQQYFPSDKVPAQYQTDIRMLTDDTTLYIGMTVHTPGSNYVIPSLERDFRAGGNDNISLVFDTFNDGTNAFLFGINPYGVRREVLISGGGQDVESGFTTSWDVKWKAETKIYDNYYTAEIAIPLTSLKFAEGETQWRFQSYRFDMQSNERSNWFVIPQNQSVINLAFMGDMYFEKPLGKSRTPLALIPYVNIISDKDFTTDENTTKLKVGGDAKIAIGNGMNLDVTLNPDFSNVEVDAIITNLTRFEVSLPERRQFFIDNNDLFGSFGSIRHSNPFFSRRIGIATDRLGNSVQNDILGGLRLSGKLNKNLRLGFLDIQTAKNEEQEITSNNNLMLALQHKVFARSNIGMFFINRQAFGDEPYLTADEEFNRVLGLDYYLASANNVWSGKYYLHKSFQPDDQEGNVSAGALLSYNSRYWNSFVDLAYIDEDFQSDLGFIPRTDIVKTVGSVQRLFWPKKGNINNHGVEVFGISNWRTSLDYQLADYEISGRYNFVLKDFTEFGAEYSNSYVYLFDPFDPTATEGAVELPGSQEYRFGTFKVGYQSNMANVFAFEGETSYGNFFNGQRFSIGGEATLRIQPKVRISLNVNYDKISLPEPYPSADLWLVSPRFGFTFSKSVFWTTLFQYSNQRDNLGINSRLQWRFAPLSDLFIVYNDNYSVNQFEPKYRSINLKFTYWLNI